MDRNFYKKNILTFITLAFVFILLALAMPAEQAFGSVSCPTCEGTCAYTDWYLTICDTGSQSSCNACYDIGLCSGTYCGVCSGNYTRKCTGSGCANDVNCAVCSGDYTRKCTGNACVNNVNCGVCSGNYTRTCSGNACVNDTNCGVCLTDWTRKCSGNACVNDTHCGVCSGNYTRKCASNACANDTNCGTDYCSGTNARDAGCSGNECFDTLKEACGTDYCSGNQRYSAGCSGNACYDNLVEDCTTKASADSDGGNVPATAGTCTDYTGCTSYPSCDLYTSYADVCGSGTSLTEYYNSGASCLSTAYGCSSYEVAASDTYGNDPTYTETCTAGTGASCASGAFSTTAGSGGADYCAGTCGTGTNSCYFVEYYPADSADSCTGLDTCTYTTYDADTESNTCNQCKGSGYWAMGGEVAASSCCGDDAGENLTSRLCSSGCTTNFSDKVCCDVSTDCVYGSTCYSTGWTGAAPWDASANGTCTSGSWSINPPTAPSGLTATSSATSTTQINLAWTDNSLNETGFRVRRANGATCSISSPLVATTAANIIVYSNSGLAEGTQYCYVVCSYNADGEACSSSSTATTSLSAPSAATFGTIAPTSMIINWTDNSTGETGFKIERAIGSCSTGFSQINTASANAITYTDTTLSCSATSYDTYCYRVRAYTADADSGYATIASTKPTLPCAASSLNASVVSASQTDLSWTDNSGNETGFKIDRKTGSGGTYSLLATKSANVTSHSDSGLSDGTTYYYKVYPYNDDGSSNYSNEVFATTTLPAPSNFLATVNSSSQINLTWTDNSSNETGFKIERATTTCSGFLSIHNTVANITSYSDEGLLQNTTYCYRAYALNDNISSSYSNESSTTTEVFFPSGYLESSTFDVGSGATFNIVLWNGQLNGGHVRFTFASSNCPNGSTDYPTCAGGSLWGNPAGGGAPFLGNDGTETGHYGPADPGKATSLRAADHNQRRYFRYRIYLTAGLSDTPNVSSVIIGYSP